MVLNFDELYNKYNLNISGVVHIGAHFGQEYKTYKKYNILNVIFFEALPHTFKMLEKNVSGNQGVITVNKALGNMTGKIEMYCEFDNQGQSSSILEPHLHKIQHPDIKFTEKMEVDIMKLDDYDFNGIKYNFMNMDVQGYELEVLKGSIQKMNDIDYVMCEVNRDEVYKNCAKIGDIDNFLSSFNFKRVEVNWMGNIWGDAFYIKNK